MTSNFFTDAQAAVFRAAIYADQAIASWVQDRRDDLIANYYNQLASPVFTVWRTSISKDEVYGSGFAWAQIDNVTEPRWRIWRELFDNDARTMNPSKLNVRQGITEVWSGTGAKVAVGDYVLGKCKRSVTRAERLFVVGTGSVAVPGDLVVVLARTDGGGAVVGLLDTDLISDVLNEN